jgi:hypothetical protein
VSRAPVGLASETGARAFRKTVFVASILLAPVVLIPGTIFNPAVGGIGAGAANIAANVAADPTTNQLHIAVYVLETFLLPLSALGLAWLAIRRSPWLATIGGGLGLFGWLPWSALAAQDDLTYQMAQMGGDQRFVALWNRFTTDGTMMFYLLEYVIGHLLAYVVLAIALRRARVIPAWAAWALALTSPLTVASFATRQHALLYVVLAFWIAGSIPAAYAAWRSSYDGGASGS